MSKSHYIIEDVHSIYSSIQEENDAQNQAEEVENFATDVYVAVATSMLHEGYSATGVLGFLSTASDEEILEKFGDYNETVISESTISEEYIEEQAQQLDEFVGALMRGAGALIKGAKYAKGGPISKLGQGLQGAGRATSRIAQQGPKASSVVRSGVSKLRDRATGALSALKSKVGGAVSTLRGGASRAVDAVKANAPKVARAVATKALPLGVGVAAGYLGRGSGSPSPSGGTPSGGTPSGGTPTPSAPAASPAPAARPAAPKLNTDQQKVNTEYDRLRKSGDMAGAAAYGKKMAQAGASKSDFKMPAATASTPSKSEATKAVKKPQGRLEKALAGVKKGDGIPESYDLVLDYLLSEGHAETLEEAHYIMLRLDADHVQEIVESAKNG